MATTSTSGLLSISGLSSGVDTTSYVTALMAAEAGPQNLLKTKLASANSSLSALQSLNTQAAALATAAKALTLPASYAAITASTTDATVATATVTGTPTAAASLSFDVVNLASAHSAIGPAWTSGSATSGAKQFVITHADGSKKTVNAASDAPADIARAINDSSTGDSALSATVVSSSDGTQKLVVSSRTSGAAGAFSLDRVTDGTTTPPTTTPYGTVLNQGRDAQITLADGTNLTSTTNTFTGLMTGVDVTVLKQGSTSLNAVQDSTGVTSKVADLVSKINALVGTIATNTASTPGSAGSAGSKNPLTGETSVSSVRQQLLSAVSGSLGGIDPADAGISADRYGNLTFDQKKFGALLTSDPATAQSVVSGMAAQVNQVATQASDPYSGTFSLMIKGEKSTVSQLTDSISDWDDRLALRKATIQAQFNAMEVAMSNLQSQGNALSAALKSLTSS